MTYPTYPFVNYISESFSNLNKIPTTILESTSNTILIENINITNLGENDIRINIKKITNTISPIEIYRFKNVLVKSYRTITNGEPCSITLNVNSILTYDSNTSQSLQCYSNSESQIFDCEINYIVLNEIPPS